jgi:hypothetical protein
MKASATGIIKAGVTSINRKKERARKKKELFPIPKELKFA